VLHDAVRFHNGLLDTVLSFSLHLLYLLAHGDYGLAQLPQLGLVAGDGFLRGPQRFRMGLGWATF
jgi:hypothetical protein